MSKRIKDIGKYSMFLISEELELNIFILPG